MIAFGNFCIVRNRNKYYMKQV